MRLMSFRLLSGINRWCLPRIHRRPDLTRLSNLEQAIVGWKIWVTYRLLDAESDHRLNP